MFLKLRREFLGLERTEHHFLSLKQFVHRLTLACRSKWDSRNAPYERVIAHWEEDELGVLKEIRELELILRVTYHFPSKVCFTCVTGLTKQQPTKQAVPISPPTGTRANAGSAPLIIDTSNLSRGLNRIAA